MKTSGIKIKGGFRAKDTKDGRIVLEPIRGYGQSFTQKLAAKKKSKTLRPARGRPHG